MEKMREHKHNVERRMQSDNKAGTYWSHRRDSLKRYPKDEALDTTWYTDNIYSNNSVDLEGEYIPPFVKLDHHFWGHRRTADIYDEYDSDEQDEDVSNNNNNIFTIRDHMHPNFCASSNMPHNRSHKYKYPKSQSCCFGGGYESQQPTPLLPKSSSFSTGRAHNNLAQIRETDHKNDRLDCCLRKLDDHPGRFYRRNNISNVGQVANSYDMHNQAPQGKRKGVLKNAYSSQYGCNVRPRDRTDCIKHDWLDYRDNFRNTDKNGNEYCGPCGDRDCNCNTSRRGNSCYPDDYLLMDEVDRSNVYEYTNFLNRHPITSCDDSELDQFGNDHDRTKFIFENDNNDEDENLTLTVESTNCATNMNESFPYSHHSMGIHDKSLLEVKAPNRFDDTSSSTTEKDLDDFYFDCEKYREDAARKNTNSPFIIDMQNNNIYNNHNLCSNLKVKNVNLSRYNNGALIDRTNNERTNANSRYFMHNINNKCNNLCDGLLPSSSAVVENQQYHAAAAAGAIPSSAYINNINYIDNDFMHNTSTTPIIPIGASPFNRFSRKVHPHRSIYNNFYVPCPPPLHQPPPPPPHVTLSAPPPPPPSTTSFRQHQLYSNNALSLINNIFSIYKPKKYSPLNCHSQQMGNKPEICKKMNVPSTIRPLGAPVNDFITSVKRPLTVTPSPCIDQPHFKIIPEKTGLKITPLYHFGYDGGDRKFKLISTARPLLFRN